MSASVRSRFWLRWFLPVLAALLLGGCGGRVPKLAHLPPDAIVLAFGDSLTYGVGADENQSYPAVLEHLISRRVVASGVPGEVTAEGLKRLPQVLEEVHPRLLILCHGGNDLLRKTGEQQASENLRAMIAMARQQGVQVMLIAVPKPGMFPSPPDYYQQIAKEFHIPVDLDSLKRILSDNRLKSDMVHPNAAGYHELADDVAKMLKQSGAI
jgi:acyl-CoA thioesterase-1